MSSSIRRSHHLLALLAAAVVAVPLLAPSAARADHHVRTAEPPDPRTIDDACPEGFEDPEHDFTDIGTSGVHVRAIRCASYHGITAGGPGGAPADQYGPALGVRRDQMASFIARLVDLADAEVDRELLPAWDGVNDFTDVDPDSPHVEAINRLADARIVLGGPQGRPETSFGPELGVTRAQLASFLNRTHTTVVGGMFVSADVYFDDLADVHVAHRQNINALAEEGLLAGRQVGDQRLYHPGATVRRDQMASFLMRDLSLLVALGVIGHTFTEPAPGSGAEPVVTEGFPEFTTFAQLVDVRLDRHDDFDRFVLEFDGDEVPAHSVRYVAPPILRAGSGEPVVIPGDAYLAVDVAGASGYDFAEGTQTYDGPQRIPLDGGAVHEAVQTGDFEAMLNWRLGIDLQRPFTVFTLSGPARLVVDVAAPD